MHPMSNNRLPVSPHPAHVPIIPVNRWQKAGGCIHKVYEFRRKGDRERFVGVLMSYELQVQHHSTMVLQPEQVSVSLTTHGVGVTELDYEFARFADQVFKDVVYSPDPGGYVDVDV